MRTKHNPLIVIALMVVVGLSVYSLQVIPAQTGNSMTSLFNRLEQQTLALKWDEASTTYQEIKERFDSYRILIMFNNAEADFNNFETHMSMIKGGILAEDKATVLSQLTAARDLWRPLVNPVPRP